MIKEDIWTELSKSYDEVLTRWSLYQEIRNRVINNFAQENKIYDQGCGSGILTIDLALHGKEVYGIDSNPHMLARAFEKIKKHSLEDKVFIKEGEILDKHFEDNTFDGIISNNVLYYVDNPKRLLEEAFRVLKKDKKIMIVGPKDDLNVEKIATHCYTEFQDKGLLPEFQKHFDNVVECNKWLKENSKIKNTYTAEELSEILIKIGFSEILEKKEDIYLGFNYYILAKK